MKSRFLLLAFCLSLVIVADASAQGVNKAQGAGNKAPAAGNNVQGNNVGNNAQGVGNNAPVGFQPQPNLFGQRRGWGSGYGGGGYGYGYGYPAGGGLGWGAAGAGSTAYGGALLGMGALTQAAGSYNLNTAIGSTYYQQAYQQGILNQRLREQTYFDMRRMNASYRAEEAMQHPHATPEEIVEFNHARLPAQLSANEFDPVHGAIEWPNLLKRPEFKDDRARVEDLFAQAAADPHGSGLGTQNYRDIQDAVAMMNDRLHSEIKQFGPDEYIPANKFLKSLAFQARTPGGDDLATK